MAAEFKINAQELIAKVEELIKEGNARRIIIKDDKGKTYIEIPVTVGVIGALFAPIVAAVGALAGLAANFTIEVIKKDDEESSQKSE
jgi:phage-related minor tail protein